MKKKERKRRKRETIIYRDNYEKDISRERDTVEDMRDSDEIQTYKTHSKV